MACSRSITNDEVRHRVKNVYAKFVSDVDPDRLSDWLVQETVITIDEKQRIRNTNHTITDRCRALLDRLLSIQHPRAFLVVRQALQKENHYLLEFIDDQDVGVELQTESVQHDRIEQLENNSEDRKTAEEVEKDHPLKIITEHKDQKKRPDEEKDRLLKMSKVFETKLDLAPNTKDVLISSSSNTDCFTKLVRMKKLLCTELSDMLKDESYLKLRHLVERPTIKEADLENFWSLALPYIIQCIKTWNGNVLSAQNIAAMVERTQKQKRTSRPSSNDIHERVFYPVSRLDCIAYIINTADSMVAQDILSIISKFPMAMPLVIPDIKEYGKYLVVAPALQNITVKWESVPCQIAENHLFSSPFRMICAVRLGTNKIGKSTILNQLMRKQFMFSSCGEPGSRYGRPLTLDGTVEIVWLTQETCSETTWKTTVCDHYKRDTSEVAILANLHGDALQYPETLKYLEHLACSFIVFRMPNSTDDAFNYLRKLISSQNLVPVLLDAKESLDEESDMETIYSDSLTSDDAQDTVRSLLRCSLNTHLNTKSPHPKPLCDLRKSKSLRYTESLQCKQSEEILGIVREHGCFTTKRLLLNIDVHQHTWWNENLKRLLRSLLDIFKLHHSDAKKSLVYLENQLSQLSANESVAAREQVNEAKEKLRRITCIVKAPKNSTPESDSKERQHQADLNIAQTDLKAAIEKVEGITLGLEHFLRALGHMYEKSFGSEITDLGDFNSIRDLPIHFADMLISGHAIELLNGDSGEIQLVWIKKVCENVTKKLPNLKVFIISIIGVQSSGKSTLLSALFSCRFVVSVGQCSRGLFMRLIFMDVELQHTYGCDAILLIDTVGLCSSEIINDPKARNKNLLMTTFAMGVSNLSMVNILGEGMTEMTAVLHIVIVAMARLRRVEIKPDIIMVQHEQERNSFKIDQARYQFCEAINKAFELIDKFDVEIHSAYEECLIELTSRVQSGDLFMHLCTFRDGSSVNSPPSEAYHEDVLSLFQTLIRRTNAQENKSTFERWSYHLESCLWYARREGCVLYGLWNFYFKLSKRSADVKYFDVKFHKVLMLLACSMQHHIECFANKIREQVNLLILNKQNMRTDAMRKDMLGEIERKLQASPLNCPDACEMCKECKNHYISLLQQIKSSEWREEIKDTLEECNDFYHVIWMKELRQTFDESVVKQEFFSECSDMITRELKHAFESRQINHSSSEEQRTFVDSLWRFLECSAVSKESVPDLHTRMTQALRQEYADSGVLPNILQHLATEISVEELLNTKATRSVLGALKLANEKLTKDQMTCLISELDTLIKRILKTRRQYYFVTGLDFEEGMVSEIRTKFTTTIKDYEDKFKITLLDNFKTHLQIYTLQQFRNLMGRLQTLWNGRNKPSEILLQKKGDYITEIEIRFKYGFSCAGEGEIVGKRLCKSIKLNAIQDAKIQAIKDVSRTTNCERTALHYSDTFDMDVELTAVAKSALKHFADIKQSAESLFSNDVDSVRSEESFRETYRSTLIHELHRVKEQISNCNKKEDIDKIVKERIKNTDDQYYSQFDPEDDDIDAFRSCIIRILDSFIDSEDSN